MPARFLLGVMLTDRDREKARYQASALGLKLKSDDDTILLASGPDTPILNLQHGQTDVGSVIGDLFACGIPRRLEHLERERLEPDLDMAIARTAGQRLTEAFWGDYVAVVRTDGGAALIRAPFGRLPCLLQTMERGLLAASDLDTLLAASGLAPSVDHGAIIRQLIAGSLRHSWTCLTGIEDLRGGDRITATSNTVVRDQIWSPWKFVDSKRSIFDAGDAARRLRHTAMSCVALRSARFQRPLLMLSGGLDSSITGACLAATARPFACLNLITPADSAGDESRYARGTAGHLGIPLTERAMGDPGSDITEFARSRLPRPGARSFEQMLFSQAARFAEETGCDGIIDGGAGDNVFGAVLSASPAADCLLDPEGHRHFRRVCADIATLVQAPRWKVAWRARRRAFSAHRPFRWAADVRFLAKEGEALAQEAIRHPWIDAHGVHLPGRAAHIAMIAAAQCVAEDGPHGARSGAISPLLAQPLVEQCLAIPSWHWFSQGHNRAAARRAFEDHLPSEVAWRRSKGAPDSAAISLFQRHRDLLRDRLVGGQLATSGLIDIAAIRSFLDDPRPVTGTNYGRVMDIFDAECWVGGIRDQDPAIETMVP